MPYHCKSLQLLAVVVSVPLAAQSRAQHPEPIVYNQVIEAPLPGPFVADFKIFDWDGDGKADLLTTGGDHPYQRIYWHRGVGSKKKLLFENGFDKDSILIQDERLGRGFGFIDWNGNGQRDMISFGRQNGVADIGKKPINLNVYHNQGTAQKPLWKVVAAQNSRGGGFLIGENVWVSATLEVVDWDADGREDLLISIWHPKVYLPVGSKHDGHLNPLANYNANSAYVYWVRNVSTGDVPVFQPPVRLSAKGIDLTFHCWAYLNVCDFNGDGLHDLLIGEHKPGMHVFLNAGSRGKPDLVYHGLLKDETGKPIKTMMSIHPEMGDLDADGRPELVTSPYFSGTYGFSLYRHDGRSGLERGWKYQGLLPCRTVPSSCIVGQTVAGPDIVDWDNDGDRDLILGSEPGLIFLVENVGSDSHQVFNPPRRLKFAGGDPIEIYSVDIGRGSTWGPSEFYFERTTPRVGDWDQDGVLDILTGSMGARLVWFKGVIIEGEIRFRPPRIMRMDGRELEVSQRLQPDLLDWNGDGKLDIVAADEANYACVFLGNGTEELLSMQPFKLVDGKKILTNENYKNSLSGRRSFAMADWNGDGHRDLFVYKSYDGFHYYRGTGKAGVFEKSVNLFPSFQGHNGGVTIADWDSDGLLDILTGGDARNVMGSDVSPIRRRGFSAKGHLFVIKGQITKLPPAPAASL